MIEDIVICPYCGHKIEDSDGSFISILEGNFHCEDCGKDFFILKS